MAYPGGQREDAAVDEAPRARRAGRARAEQGMSSSSLASSIGKSMLRSAAVIVTGKLTRGLLGALMGSGPKRRRR